MTKIIIIITLFFVSQFLKGQHTETRDINGFSGIQVSRSVDVIFTQSQTFNIKVETDLLENLPYITTIREQETLIVTIDKQFNNIVKNASWKTNKNKTLYLKKAIVYISAPNLSFIKCSSSGNFTMTNTLKATDLLIETSSSGNIIGNIEAKNVFLNASSSGDFKGQIQTKFLEAKVSSSGDINISGVAEKSEISVSSSGDFKGKGFRTKEASISVSSSGDTTIYVETKLKANANSSGSIYVYGNPSLIDKKTSSSGSIKQL